MIMSDRCSVCTYLKHETPHVKDCIAGLQGKVSELEKLVGRLRAEIAGLQDEMRIKQREIISLRQENTELRFNWIAAAEGL